MHCTKYYDFAQDLEGGELMGHGYVRAPGGGLSHAKLCAEEALRQSYNHLTVRVRVRDAITEWAPEVSQRERFAFLCMLECFMPTPIFLHLWLTGHKTMRFVFRSVEDVEDMLVVLQRATSRLYMDHEMHRFVSRNLFYASDVATPLDPDVVHIQVVLRLQGDPTHVVTNDRFFRVDEHALRYAQDTRMDGHRFWIDAGSGETTMVSAISGAFACVACGGLYVRPGYFIYNPKSEVFKDMLNVSRASVCSCRNTAILKRISK